MHQTPHNWQIVGEPPAHIDRMITIPKDVTNALRDFFLANADHGDNAANDELIDALV